MSRALAYLWLALLKRKVRWFCRSLRRPTTTIGIASVLFLIGVCLYYRSSDVFSQLVRPESLLGGALIMFCGSLFKGFLQRGLAFDPADVEFVFTSPFTRRQIILYRLAPSYVFALVQSLVFLAIFTPHLRHPIWTSLCLLLFQIGCFHIAAAAAMYASTLSDALHHRVRWMMLGMYCFICALYLRWAWDLKFVPASLTGPMTQWLFYPAVSMLDVGTAPQFAEWIRDWSSKETAWNAEAVRLFWILTAFALGAVLTLCGVLKMKADLFEGAMAATARVAEKRQRIRRGGREITLRANDGRSVALSGLPLFQGVGAILWKNFLIARRCRRELFLALGFTLIFSGFLGGLLWAFRELMNQSGSTSARELADFQRGITLMVAALGFFLQWTFSFDFRRDGKHLLNLRTLPFGSLAVAVAEVTVPSVFCLGFQALGALLIILFTGLDWQTILLMGVGFPAVAFALNGVWNLHYLLAATRHAVGQSQSTTAVGTLMVVALSFLVFYPAVWIALTIGEHAGGREHLRIGFALATGLAVQYFVDFVLILVLAMLYDRFQVVRDT